jgi:hypothetical protein
MRLVLNNPVPDSGGNVVLKLVSGDAKLWEHSTKGVPVALVNGEMAIPTSQLPRTLWVEARSPSAALRDIVLELHYKGAKDTVKATAVWVTKTERPAEEGSCPWFNRQVEDGFPNNPEAGEQLPAIVKDTLRFAINNTAPYGVRAADGSRYGFGSFRSAAGVDSHIGGRILFEFQVSPEGAESLVVFDVTRQIESRDFAMEHGSGEWNDPAPRPPEDFPWLQAPRKDNELPNDDEGNVDEQNLPSNQLLYSFDGPGVLIDQNYAFVLSRNTFKELVRVRVADEPFEDSAEVPLESVQGSRASPKYDWHLLCYLRNGAEGRLVVDDANPSHSQPTFSGVGNGTVSVTLLAEAATQGFSATYDAATFKWTLTGTSGNSISDEKAEAPPGATWTLTIPETVTVQITQGTVAFGVGDQWLFSAFKSSAPDGKQNVIGLGYKDVREGP